MQNKAEQEEVKNIFVVNKDSEGQRIDNFLLKRLKEASKSNIYKLLRKGQIRVNGGRIKPVYKVKHEDVVRIPPFLIPDEKGELYISDNLIKQIKQSVIFENKNFIVVNKPSGLAVHSGTGIRVGLVEVCKKIFPSWDVQLAHRLDRGTSGCVVLAKNREALNVFNLQSKENTIVKKYSALVRGVINDDFIVELNLDISARINGERTVRVCEDGKWSKTKFCVAEKYNAGIKATLLQCQLFTGRTHQIRVHCAEVGHPLAGDDRYGDNKYNAKLKKAGLKRIFLHASSIQFNDGDESIVASAELPEKLLNLLSAL